MTKLHLDVSPLLLPISLKMKVLNISLLDVIVSLEHEVSHKAKSAVTPTICDLCIYLYIQKLSSLVIMVACIMKWHDCDSL